MSERLQLPPCLPGSRHKSGSYLVPQCREFLFPLGFALRMGDAHPVRKYPAHQVFVYQRPQHPQGGQRETFWQRQLDFVGFRLFQYIVQCFLFVRYLLFRVRVQHFHAFGMCHVQHPCHTVHIPFLPDVAHLVPSAFVTLRKDVCLHKRVVTRIVD